MNNRAEIIEKVIDKLQTVYNAGCAGDTLSHAKADEILDLIVDEAVKVVIAEPEIIDSSTSYRQGYARCSRDNEKTLKEKFK